MIEEPRLCECCGSSVFVVELWEDAAEVKLCASCRAAYQDWRLDPGAKTGRPRMRLRPDVVTFVKERSAWLIEKQQRQGLEKPPRPLPNTRSDPLASETLPNVGRREDR